MCLRSGLRLSLRHTTRNLAQCAHEPAHANREGVVMTWVSLLCIGTLAIAAISFAVSRRVAIRRLLRGGGSVTQVSRSRLSLTGEASVSLPRLVFPALSLLPGTGRAHWLAMLHRELSVGNFPQQVDFGLLERVQDDCTSGERTLRGRDTQDPDAPWTVEMFVHDGDPLGRSRCCAAIQEYRSDERLKPEDRTVFGSASLRTCHGVFVFLDPTRVTEADRRHVVAKLEECRDIHGGHRKRAGIPVAVCVPKIDLLASRAYPDAGSVRRIDDFCGGLAESGWGFDEPAIMRRSKLTQDLCDLIWPGWEVEKAVGDVYGCRYVFFPLTPVGLADLDETDVSRRAVSPMGVLHPLMWLLHMNGYATLPQPPER